MAKIVGNLVKLDNGQLITPQTGGWYDGAQFWGGTLSQPGQINPQSNQPGAGGLVSNEVIAQTSPGNVAYIAEQRKKMALAPSPATGVPGGQGTPTTFAPSGAETGAGAGIPSFGGTPALNLPEMYKSLFDSSGISAEEETLTLREKQFLEARNKISDNPFISASMVDKRLQRLQNKYEAETAPIRSKVAMRKADIETQLNLQTKQFDINSQSAKQALDYFNTLLTAGALDNASGDDIANLTRSTGLSSTLLQSAITASKAKNATANTKVIESTADDGTVTASVINTKTGEVIKQSNLGRVGNAQTGGGGGTATERKEAEQQATSQNLVSDAQRGATLRALTGHYGGPGGLDIETIYRLYNTYSSFGKASETLEQVKEGKYKD